MTAAGYRRRGPCRPRIKLVGEHGGRHMNAANGASEASIAGQAAPETRIVLWVTTISTELAFQAMGLGIRGVLRKQLPPELQVKCLQKVHAGELWCWRKSLRLRAPPTAEG